MANTTPEAFLQQLQEIFTGVQLSMDTQLQAQPNWDSLALALLLNLLRGQYGCEVELHQLLACKTPQDMWQLLQA